LASNDARNTAIARQYLSHRERYGKTIIFAERWYQCERIAALLNAHHVRAGSVYSHIDAQSATVESRNARRSTENAVIIDKFKRGELDVLINVKMLTEGTDVPNTQTVFITRQTTSDVLLTQMVGRALRGPRAGGTKEAYIVSFEDNWTQRINWAEFDQLREGPIAEVELVNRRRLPTDLISIDLMRRLVSQMDSTVNQTPAPFLKLMPVGWFRVEIQALVQDTEDIETVRPLIMVFDDQQRGFHDFLEHLQAEDLDTFASERVIIEEVRPILEGWLARFFPDSGDMIGKVDIKDLFYLARHYAQNDRARPTWFPFEHRGNYDLDVVAERNIREDLKQSELNERIRAEYENPERYWKTLYPEYINFKTQYDACVNRLEATAPEPKREPLRPVEPPAPPEPPEHIKRAVIQRDRMCLCCGETEKKLLQVDHIESRYMGGTHAIENLQTLCKECNSQKGTMHANFRKHRDPERMAPSKSLPNLRIKNLVLVGNPDFWCMTLRRSINLFYGAAAVGEVKIGKRGRSFYDWSIELLGENDGRWIEPHLRQLVEEIREARSRAGKEGPEGIRVKGAGGVEVVYFTGVDVGEASAHLRGIPNGTLCRLAIDGRTHEGTILRGMLKVGSHTPFSSLSAAFEILVGRSGKALRAWELQIPGSTEWRRADKFFEQTRVEQAD